MNEISRWERMITQFAPLFGTDSHLPVCQSVDVAGRCRRDVASMQSLGNVRARSSIVSVERQTESSVLVSWSDPTCCRYDEQRWINAKSRMRALCALSGRVIRPGDPVYKPQWRGARRPANGAEMILTTELERLIVELSRH
ncbi:MULTISPECIES: DUF3331 domain-containing protein [Burkholderia]|uniref:DUF3331 domain-containing protein n=1 Tax=Burkholderia contaminans TaxID=488447 RepID=A0A3N8P9A3_9BURK|nr:MULTISPECIES: DUF3331 domain-containing protein [Burkholderia]MCA8061407.1 DUF3331 domain-containing protein [Burkholderia sp. AU38729]MCA8251990.1 DUF3331 domain-containing protein [Burkholderia sp. AU31624]MEB4642581.1 DUF3331 domain-containing protein [Burkholderia contaminans]MEB4657588.1 DUF3331 domain-containing protein [Burkholderia contaminans]MEB4658936.1 DUF3331 domain-containing protein [Burkholderia contaminans]